MDQSSAARNPPISMQIRWISAVMCADSSARKFNPTTRTWHEVAPMHLSRCYVCAAVLDSHIYACGGFDGVNRHKSAERYTPSTNQWNFVADMIMVRSDAGACGLNGEFWQVPAFCCRSSLFSDTGAQTVHSC